jgi:RNA polymerase sigma-70 factor (ECF subfamily)
VSAAGERSDAELLRAWQDGDQAAGNVLVRRHFSTMYRFFRSRVDDDVADLVQRTFLACVKARDRFPADVEFRAWALGIARKELLMALRKHHRGARVIETKLASGLAGGPTPSAAAADGEQQRALLGALRRLPVDLQLLLELYYWEELPLAEIAPIFEIPQGTVKSRLHRARTLLGEELGRTGCSADAVTSSLRGLESWARELRKNRDPPP